MTTSGINTFNLTRNQIIDMALERIGVKTFNRSQTNAETLQATRYLNTMVKAWKNKGLNLWKSAQGILWTNPNQAAYVLDGLTANATENYLVTTVTVDQTAGQAEVNTNGVIPYPAGTIIGWNVGIMQDNQTIFWGIIESFDGAIIGLSAPLDDDVSVNNPVYIYETKIKRPETLNSLQLFNTSTVIFDDLTATQQTIGQSIRNVINSNDTYFNIPTLGTSGIPNTVYYNRQLNSGTIYLWPTPNQSYYATFTFQKQYDDFTSANDTPDFPPEWLEALYLNLALKLAPVYGKTIDEDLRFDAKQALDDCEGYDREETTIYLQPATTHNIYNYR